MDQLRQGIDPRPMTPRKREFAKALLDGPKRVTLDPTQTGEAK
jgi:hypothetical protein